MPNIDFNTVDDVQDFSPLPEGPYFCRLAEVEESATQKGDDMWKLRWVVESGEHRGRYIFDNMVFSQAALPRAKLICSRLGLDVSGELDLIPSAITDRTCNVTVDIEEYEDHEGNLKRRNVVPFAGYERTDQAVASSPPSDGEGAIEDDAEDDLPF